MRGHGNFHHLLHTVYEQSGVFRLEGTGTCGRQASVGVSRRAETFAEDRVRRVGERAGHGVTEVVET